MAQFESPAAAFGQGFQGGANLLMQVNQAREQRKAKEWERDLNVMKTGIDAAATKGITKESRAKILSNVGGIYSKYYGMNPFEGMQPHEVEKADDFVRFTKDAIGETQKDPSKASFYLGEINIRANDFRNKILGDKEQMDQFNEMVKGPENYFRDLSADQEKKNEPAIKAPDAMKRRSALVQNMLNTTKGIVYDEASGKTIQIQLNPQAKRAKLQTDVQEHNYLNQFVPEDQRQTVILKSDLEEKVASGVLTGESLARAKELIRSGKYQLFDDH